jgi:hypothetical protein
LVLRAGRWHNHRGGASKKELAPPARADQAAQRRSIEGGNGQERKQPDRISSRRFTRNIPGRKRTVITERQLDGLPRPTPPLGCEVRQLLRFYRCTPGRGEFVSCFNRLTLTTTSPGVLSRDKQDDNFSAWISAWLIGRSPGRFAGTPPPVWDSSAPSQLVTPLSAC